jgi:hypothetical protein
MKIKGKFMEHGPKRQPKHNKEIYQIKFKIHLKNWLSWLIIGYRQK